VGRAGLRVSEGGGGTQGREGARGGVMGGEAVDVGEERERGVWERGGGDRVKKRSLRLTRLCRIGRDGQRTGGDEGEKGGAGGQTNL